MRRLGGVAGATALLLSCAVEAQVFMIDTARTSVTLDGKLAGFDAGEQAPGSLTTHLSGTINVEFGASTIRFTGGSQVALENSGDWAPLPNGEDGTAPANFGGKASILLGSAVAAVRDGTLDITSPELPIAAEGFDAAQLVFIIPEGSGAALDYRISSFLGTDGGREPLAGLAENQVGTSATLVTSGTIQTLTIPVNASYLFELIVPDDTTLTIAGQIVATRSLGVIPNPNAYGGWALEKFQGETNPAIVAREADPDFDWLANFVEFAFDLDPLTKDIGFAPLKSPLASRNPAKWVMEYVRPMGRVGVAYKPAAANVLGEWTGVEMETTVTDLGNGTEKVTLSTDHPGVDVPSSFILLTVEGQ